ncbi:MULTISPECIES: Flp pilus assembly protein CpaB [unclassified Parvimonas]|uniref:Flp pilus assembly protein CpaB n=1 Tax=unclassified Parvimonas TaxID=1151464 RepID=UPI002B459202|nr:MULTISPECIES: Flp pilus assembly protein CpaB [unclassified Parvimonas]MEB3024442.1 Flp pilus assembly protein CpaB [Parvimonas sp. M13]MEB3072489.1 Flp pilus assembly protein CpaB [Parvimonas sp. C2]MEB3088728.1 Flp pilus assembly protein CpaB [Parvimonas sp. M20]
MKKIRIVALVSALAVMVFLGIYLSGISGSRGRSKGSVEVVVANEDIPANSIIKESQLKKIYVSKDSVPENSISNPDEIVGKMSKSAIYKDEVVIKERIIEKAEGNSSPYGLAYVVSVGKRAMSIEVTLPQGVSNSLKVGNYIDVYYSGSVKYTVINSGKGSNDNKEKQKEELTKEFSKLLLQDVKVIGLESNIEQKDSEKGSNYKTVTLELSPQDFAKLVFAINNGTVWLGLRAEGDHEIVKTEDVLIDDLVDKSKLLKVLKEEFER